MIRASLVARAGGSPLRRPAIKPLLTGMPTVDLMCTARPLVVSEIGQACRQLGCFQVVNHGIEDSVLHGAMEVARQFFELEEEEKRSLASLDLTKPVRYSVEEERRSMLKQYSHPLDQWIQFWPINPPAYREKMSNYTIEVRRVALKLLDAILESLGLDASYLRCKLEEGLQLVAANYYPRLTSRNPVIGAPPHTDPGYITILLQSCQGLQIMGDNTGEGWKTVSATPGTLHVHVGDYLEVLSNGRYKSLMHRAMLNREKARITIASIQNLAIDEKVATAAVLVNEKHPVGYRECSFRNYVDYLSSNDYRQRSFLDILKLSRQ